MPIDALQLLAILKRMNAENEFSQREQFPFNFPHNIAPSPLLTAQERIDFVQKTEELNSGNSETLEALQESLHLESEKFIDTLEAFERLLQPHTIAMLLTRKNQDNKTLLEQAYDKKNDKVMLAVLRLVLQPVTHCERLEKREKVALRPLSDFLDRVVEDTLHLNDWMSHSTKYLMGVCYNEIGPHLNDIKSQER